MYHSSHHVFARPNFIKHNTSTSVTERAYNERSCFIKEVTFEKTWNYDQVVATGPIVSFCIIACFQERNLSGFHFVDKGVFYSRTVPTAHFNNGKVNNPDASISCDYLIEHFSGALRRLNPYLVNIRPKMIFNLILQNIFESLKMYMVPKFWV